MSFSKLLLLLLLALSLFVAVLTVLALFFSLWALLPSNLLRVYREGDAPDGGLYFIVEGRVDVLVNSAGWHSSSTGDEGGSSPDTTNTDSQPTTPTNHAHTR